MFIVNIINAEKFGICSCFRPAYDGSCCIVAKGKMNGNVCEVPDLKYVQNYEKCCNKIKGKVKCKTGYKN
jgi:hypothetical protein